MIITDVLLGSALGEVRVSTAAASVDDGFVGRPPSGRDHVDGSNALATSCWQDTHHWGVHGKAVRPDA